MMDIYFDDKYGKMNEYIEEGQAHTFTYEDEEGCVKNLFMLKEISFLIDGKKYYDIRTPYGYGGPFIKEVKGNKDVLCKNYMNAFKKYCIENNIVSEFIRFHPVIDNGSDFEDVMNVEPIRETVCTYFKEGVDPITDEFHKSTRKVIRRALKNDLYYKTIKSPENLDEFIKIYYDTMDRNKASDAYYFGRDYFDYMMDNFRDNIINVNVYTKDDLCIASGLYFVYGKNMHAHLSGTKMEYLHLSPAYVLKYATAKYGSENGYSYIHYGGGVSNNDDDPLLKFKKKFTKSPSCTFKIGKNIYMPEIYEKLLELNSEKKDGFFPAYRRI